MNKTKIFNLGKIDLRGHGRRTYTVEVKLEVNEQIDISVNVYNIRHNILIEHDKNLSNLLKFQDIRCNPTFQQIFDIWKLYNHKRLEDVPEENKIIISNLLK